MFRPRSSAQGVRPTRSSTWRLGPRMCGPEQQEDQDVQGEHHQQNDAPKLHGVRAELGAIPSLHPTRTHTTAPTSATRAIESPAVFGRGARTTQVLDANLTARNRPGLGLFCDKEGPICDKPCGAIQQSERSAGYSAPPDPQDRLAARSEPSHPEGNQGHEQNRQKHGGDRSRGVRPTASPRILGELANLLATARRCKIIEHCDRLSVRRNRGLRSAERLPIHLHDGGNVMVVHAGDRHGLAAGFPATMTATSLPSNGDASVMMVGVPPMLMW